MTCFTALQKCFCGGILELFRLGERGRRITAIILAFQAEDAGSTPVARSSV